MRKGFIRNPFYTKPKKGLEFVANCRTLFWFRIIPFFFSVIRGNNDPEDRANKLLGLHLSPAQNVYF
jgi:hypothetical protein